MDWQTLNVYAHKLGSNALLSQGPGGNVSVKHGDVMWVKKSGYWLSDALTHAIFVPVDLKRIRTDIRAQKEKQLNEYLLENEKASPSIETFLHAVMPHRYVVHCHPVNVLKHVICLDGKKTLAKKMSGMKWSWIDYHKPGSSLAKAIAQAPQAGIYFLANHGVLVGADSIEEAHNILLEIDSRLCTPESTALTQVMPDASVAIESYRIPPYREIQFLSKSEKILAALDGKFLFPDQVVFLHNNLTILDDVSSPQPPHPQAACVIIKDRAVLIHKTSSKALPELLLALALILSRVEDFSKVKHLTPEQVSELVNWDAETLRKTLN